MPVRAFGPALIAASIAGCAAHEPRSGPTSLVPPAPTAAPGPSDGSKPPCDRKCTATFRWCADGCVGSAQASPYFAGETDACLEQCARDAAACERACD